MSSVQEMQEKIQWLEQTLEIKEKELKDALQSKDFYKKRVDAFQSMQKHMRDPERTVVCDILANGQLLTNGQGQLCLHRYGAMASRVVLPHA